jgi:hypothetical protein
LEINICKNKKEVPAMKRTFKESMQAFAVKQALHYLDKDPEKDFPKIIRWAEKFDKDGKNARLIQPFHNFIKDPDNNWNIMIKSLWTDIDRDVFKVFFENFIVNASLAARHRHVKYREEHGCNIPWAILMDLTSACNLKCMGCWAADYGNKLNLEYEVLDDIIRQGKDLGTYMYIYSGGEPLVRKDDIIRLCEAHPDCMFLAFTNGTLIDEKLADEGKIRDEAMITISSSTIILPGETLLYLLIIRATISVPPVLPPWANVSAIPNPASAPPKIQHSIGPLLTANS